MSLPPILAFLSDDMRRVDALIRSSLQSDVVLIREVAEYIISGGGKRLRPAVLLLSASAAGCRSDARFALAVVIEFIHTATLLHDDVVDESRLRRGRETANAAFGNAASVLVGDFVYSRAFQMMIGVDSMRVMQVLADATNAIAEGEVMQLLNTRDPDVDETRYLEVIRRKTAKLFEASGRLGAILGGADSAIERGLADYGMHLGTAFQLIDDVLDYSGEEGVIGKHLGDDLAEGKPTLPLIRAMQVGSEADAALIRSVICEGGRAELGSVLEAIRRCGALDYARAAAERAADAARSALAPLPDSEHKRSLIELSAFSVTRRY